MPPILEIERAGRRVFGSWIWRDLFLQVEEGCGTGVVGPSGSGKTLFLRALAGLDDLQEGRLRFRGKPLQERFMPEYRSRVVYLHQRAPLLEGSVEDNLLAVYGFRAHRGSQYDRRKVLAMLEALGCGEGFLRRNAAYLSGGEAQMAAVVRALQIEPLVLLLDEPAASMDAESASRLEELILSWRSSQAGRAFLLTSHDRAQIARLCTQTLTLE